MRGTEGLKGEIWGGGRAELSGAGGQTQTYDCIQIKTHPTMHHCPAILCTYGWTKKSSADASANTIICPPPHPPDAATAPVGLGSASRDDDVPRPRGPLARGGGDGCCPGLPRHDVHSCLSLEDDLWTWC